MQTARRGLTKSIERPDCLKQGPAVGVARQGKQLSRRAQRPTGADVKPAPNPNTPGTLTLSVSSVTIRGSSYPLEASIDSLETVHKGRGVTTGDAAKVGAGAAAGAILGRVIGGNKRGTIIGGIVGGAVGAGVAQTSKDSDIVLPAGAHINITLTKPLTVRPS